MQWGACFSSTSNFCFASYTHTASAPQKTCTKGFVQKQVTWISQQTNPCDLLQNKYILKVLRKLNLGRWHKLSDSHNLWQFLTRFESGRRGSDSNCISSLHSQYIHFHWHHSRLENEMSLWWPVQTIVKQIFMPNFEGKPQNWLHLRFPCPKLSNTIKEEDSWDLE